MKRKILIIEDNPTVGEDLVEILDTEGFETTLVPSGVVGVEIARKIQPDLILCDIMMPEIDGYEVLRQLRQNIETALTPFIFLTAKNAMQDQRKGMELGADDYITKPYTIDGLLSAINTRLSKHDEVREKAESKLKELSQAVGMPLIQEFSAPLKGIMGLSELIMKEYETMDVAEIAEFVSLIHQSGRRLEEHLKKTQTFYKLEVLSSNPDELTREKSKVTNLSKDIIEDETMRLAKANGRVSDVFLHVEQTAVAIPEDLLRELVHELVDNALKFSMKRKPVKVIANTAKEYLELAVHDEGVGMKNDQVNSIGAYMQFDKQELKQHGIGLGLHNCRLIAKLWGGTFKIDSEVGQGTVIKVSLPLAQQVEATS